MLKSWLRAANPFTPPRGMLEAQRAAKAMSFALVVGAALSLLIGVYMALHPEITTTLTGNQYARMRLPPEQIELQRAFMEAFMPTAMLVAMIFGAAIYLVLAWAQWKYMTRAIPIILLALFAYGAVTGLVAVLTGLYAGQGQMYRWILGCSWVIHGLCGLVYLASMRGAFMLHRLRLEP